MAHTNESPFSAGSLSPAEALSSLLWLADAGVDDTIADGPADWFSMADLPVAAPKAAPATTAGIAAPITPPTAPQPTPVYAAQSTASLIESARTRAAACDSLDSLRAAVEAFEGCAIKKLATRTVFADGNPDSGLMLIGESPDADDDREGIPFCGVSGKLLDRMLLAIGRTRSEFYVTNSLFWRPPGNRTPSADELAICRPFVERHIALVKPKHLVLVGGISAQSLLSTEEGVTRLRTRTHIYCQPDGVEIPASVLFHPSYLLRHPSHKALAWQDLLRIKAILEGADA